MMKRLGLFVPGGPARVTARRLALVALATAMLGSATSSALAANGDRFSFAEVSDPDSGTSASAFPGERAWWAGVCDLHASSAAVGTLPAHAPACIDQPATELFFGSGWPLASGVSPADGDLGSPDGWNGAIPSWRKTDVDTAGGHPDGSGSFWFSRSPDRARGSFVPFDQGPDGSPRDITVNLPAGVVGNPNAIPKCPSDRLTTVPVMCPPKTQVGVSTVNVGGAVHVVPVYNVEPRKGNVAEFILSGAGLSTSLISNAPVVARVRTDGDFGVDAMALQIPSGLSLIAQTFTIWGVPWAASHDRYRPIASYCGTPDDGTLASRTIGMPVNGLGGGFGGTPGGNTCSQEPQGHDPSWGPIRPFLTTQSECSPVAPVTSIVATNWHTPVVAEADSPAPLLTGCGDLPFAPSFTADPTSSQADGPTGLDVGVTVPQNNDPPAGLRFDPDDDTGAPAHWDSPQGRATAHLDKTVVTLPEGLSVNPSGAAGLQACSDAEVGLTQLGNPPRFNDEDPFDGTGVECPAGSRIGTVDLETPLLDEHLTGDVVLGEPKSTDPQSGEMLRLFLVVRNKERGLVAKVYGTSVADPATGRLTATFDKNPQVPFEHLDVNIKGGDRGLLAMPQRCVSRGWSAMLTPWSAAHGAGGQSVPTGGSVVTNTSCAFGFAPTLAAGMDTRSARGSGTFSFRFARPQGDQTLSGLTAKLPDGLLAAVKDVPLCKDAQAATGSCPAGSKIGIIDAAAGSGDPFVLEEKGEVFLTEGYKGGEYGLAIKVRGIAGPFRGSMELSPIVVRQAIHVNRDTAQVTAVSDPFPQIHHGVPLRVREVVVLVNRSGFMLNPSDCSSGRVDAAIASAEGQVADRSVPFQATGCATLPFRPKLALALTGRKQVKTGKHPGVKATVTQQGVGEAGIEQAVVRLPKSLALDPDNAQALCEFTDGTKPDIENRCPKGSIVGRARATSPLLNDPLVGNVYFVKNVRIDPKTGNQIRTLPMIVVALRGEIAVNLKGVSSTTKSGKLVNTFASVPDAPVSRFNLNIAGGKNGILAVTRTRRSTINLCAGRHVAEADMDGQNGRRHDFDVRMKTPCPRSAGKGAAKRGKAEGKGSKRLRGNRHSPS